jgi:putative tricarboxylic transport membrane protein
MFTWLRRRAAVMSIPVALAIPAIASSGPASGDAGGGGYPARRLSIMAPGDPGGGWDSTARTLQRVLRETKLAPKGAEVYDVPGAGGTIGLSQFASKHAGDPNQLMVMGLVMVGAIETNKSSVDLTRVTPVATLATEPEAIVVKSSSRYRTLAQLLGDFRRDPESVSFGGGSAGGADQLLVGELAKTVGVDGSKVKYVAHSGGGETNAAILSGTVTAGVTGVAEIDDQVKGGKMRALATSTPRRIDVGGKPTPTMREAGADIELSNWRGLVAPAGISGDERRQIVALVEKVHASAQWQESLKRFGWTDFFKPGPQFDAFLRQETARVQALVRHLGIEG